MRDNYADKLLIYVDIHDNYVCMQDIYVDDMQHF